MRNLFLAILIAFSCLSCVAQKTEPVKPITTSLTVNTIAGSSITFQSAAGLLIAESNPEAFRIPDNLKFEEGRIYYVSFYYMDCDKCFKKKIEIVGFTMDPVQAQKDKAELSRSAPYLNAKG